jgi:uncharacterized membrane protein
MGRAIAWSLMAFLALAVASYAIAVCVVPSLRPPLVRELIAASPLAAFTHFMGGGIALAAGAFQLNSRLRTRHLAWHRWTGRVYLVAVAFGGAAGFALALQSSAGPVARFGFGLLAPVWLATTARAYVLVRRGDIARHREWMIRSYALTLAAVTLRLYLPASQLAGLPMDAAYPAIAWLCWVPNLVAAEWLLKVRRSPPLSPSIG